MEDIVNAGAWGQLQMISNRIDFSGDFERPIIFGSQFPFGAYSKEPTDAEDGAKPILQHQKKGPDAYHHSNACTVVLPGGDAHECRVRTDRGQRSAVPPPDCESRPAYSPGMRGDPVHKPP